MKKCLYILFIILYSMLGEVVIANTNLAYFTILTNEELHTKATQHFNTQSDSSILYYSVLYNRYDNTMSIQEKELCADALLNTGIMHYRKNNYSTAMDLWLKGLKICFDNDFNHILSQIYNYIGNIYSVHYDYEQSINFYKKSLEAANESNDITLLNHTLTNLIHALCYQEKTEEAKYYFDILQQNNGDKRGRYKYDILICRAIIAATQKDKNATIDNYLKSVVVVEQEGLNLQCKGAAYNGLAKCYVAHNQLDSALKYFHLNESIARNSGTTDLLVVSLGNLANIYERKGNKEKASFYKNAYNEINDSIFNQREFNSLKNAQFLYELDNNNIIITQLTEQKRNDELKIMMQRRWLLTITIGLVIGCILLVILYIQKRDIKKAYNELFNVNQESLKREDSYKTRLALMHEMYETQQAEKISEKVETTEKNKKNDASTLNISNELRMEISNGIMHIMENEEEICNSEFNIARLSSLIGTNQRYVSQVINDDYGMNFRSLLNECRIKVAMKRLSDFNNYGNFTIKAISESVGYKSQANFIRVFSQYTGIKPSIYQKISKERN